MALFGGLFDAFTGDPAKKAAEQNRQQWGQYRNDGLGFLDTAFGQGSDAINQGIDVYRPLAQKYGAATNLGMDALGVNGADGNTRATGAFQAGPGYQFALNTGLDAIDRRAASRGMLGSWQHQPRHDQLRDRVSLIRNTAAGSIGCWVSPATRWLLLAVWRAATADLPISPRRRVRARSA